MNTMMTLPLLLVGLLSIPGRAATVDASVVGKIQVACQAQATAAKASRELKLDISIEAFCECVAKRHLKKAKKVEDTSQYLNEVLAMYKPLNKSESAQARAAYPLTDESDSEVAEICSSK